MKFEVMVITVMMDRSVTIVTMLHWKKTLHKKAYQSSAFKGQ